MKKENLIRAASAAKHLGVKRQSIYYHIKEGNLKTVDVDGVTYVDRNQVAKLKVRRKGRDKQSSGDEEPSLTSLREVYRSSILPLSEKDRLKIAVAIINDISLNTESSDNFTPRDTTRVRDLFGSVSLGRPTGADNESIDADLAKEYANTHED